MSMFSEAKLRYLTGGRQLGASHVTPAPLAS
jgi:hypothetical protein